jgi:hypothetical protein
VAPPLFVGAVNETDALLAADEEALTPVGESGFVAGVTALDADDEFDIPAPLLAVAVKV